MSMKLIQNSGIPIYQQIADAFRSDILSGKMQQGEYLPSIRGLAKELKISVITTMKAYELLEEEGAGDRHSGQRLLCQRTGFTDAAGTAHAQDRGQSDGRDQGGAPGRDFQRRSNEDI